MKDTDIKFTAVQPELDVRHIVPGSMRHRRSFKNL